jgi:hypothetical protein
MDALRLLFEGWFALSAIGFFVCACLPDNRDHDTLPAARQDETPNIYTEAMGVNTVHHF